MNAFEEGYIKDIYNWFIKPLFCYKPENTTIRDWLDYLFHSEEREIVSYRALVDFKLPGLLWEAPHRKIQGLGYRHVSKGGMLLVRKDATETTYDVEFNGGVGDAAQVYTLSESEWNSIGGYLEIATKSGRKRKDS